MSKNTLSEWQIQLAKLAKKPQKDPLFITTDLTHEDADILLELNGHNRQFSQTRVNLYEAQMNKGRWLTNGECISVSLDGVLQNGQHRLMALRQSKKTIRMSMALGVDTKTFTVNDTGRSRTAADTLHIAGYKSTLSLGAALRWFAFYQANETFGTIPEFTPYDALAMARKYPRMAELQNMSNRFKGMGANSVYHSLIYITQTINPDASFEFFMKLETGVNIQKEDAVFVLRKYLLNLITNNVIIEKRWLCASVIKAWNAHTEGHVFKQAKWDGKEFPKIAGVDRKKLFSRGSGLAS